MRRYAFICMIVVLVFTISGCGPKGESSVVEELSDRAKELDSYSSHGKLTIKSNHSSQEYDIEVWYKKPNFYRVRLKNTNRGLTQILLRNDQGVYVLTPHLKKSFRFQSDWPTKNSQIYLYQTVLSSIIGDKSRKFSVQEKKKEYQFEVSAKYPFNTALKTQQILLDDNLAPKKVTVLDDKKVAIINMEFDRFKEGASFDRDSFDLQYNMNSLKSQETFQSLAGDKRMKDVGAVAPGYVPAGCTLTDENEVKSLNGTSVIMRYVGKKPFTLTQRLEQTMESNLLVQGEPIDLGDTLGVLFEQGKRRKLTWIDGHIEFELQGDLSRKELIDIATSTAAEPMK